MELVINQNNISPPTSGDEYINNTWKKLPKKIIQQIFSYLSHGDLARLEIAHKGFWKFTHDPESILYRWILTSKLLNESEKLAAQNDIDVQTQLIHRYRGFDTIKNYPNLMGKDLASYEILYLAAFQGSKNALLQLVSTYRHTKDPKIQKEMLDFIKACADNGHNFAVEMLFLVYTEGYFGLDANSPDVQKTGFELIDTYAEQHSESAIKCLLSAVRDGLLGYNNTPESTRFMIFSKCAKHYMDLGSQEAAIILLEAFAYNKFGLSPYSPQVDEIKNQLVHSKYYLQKLLGIHIQLMDIRFPLRSFESDSRITRMNFEEAVEKYKKLMQEEFPDLTPKNYTWENTLQYQFHIQRLS